MTLVLAIIAAFTLASAACAFSRRNLIHSALLLILTWAGVAGFYLWAGAEFVAFAQVLIYGGAVSMIVLFAVLLTRRSIVDPIVTPASRSRVAAAMGVGTAVVAVLVAAVLNTSFGPEPVHAPTAEVRQIGFQLMGPQAGSLLVIGVILTIALIGATILAASDRENPRAVGASARSRMGKGELSTAGRRAVLPVHGKDAAS